MAKFHLNLDIYRKYAPIYMKFSSFQYLQKALTLHPKNNKKMKKFILTTIVMVMAANALAQSVYLSLDSCISLSIKNNKDIAISELNKDLAKYSRKEAFTHYLPRVDAMGGYLRNEKEISLLNDDQKTSLTNMGTAMGTAMGEKTATILTGLAQQNPQMAPLFQQIGGVMQQLTPELVQNLNGVGAGLVDALRTDTRNVTAAALMLTQPIYMGGKIVAYNKITRYAEQIAEAQSNQKIQEMIVQVETAYWQIVDLESKRELALSYKNLIDTLDYNVQQLINEGLASKADGLSVKVKKNEAEVTIIQIDNGLALSRMLLCQLCGIDINTDIHPTDDVLSAPISNIGNTADCIGTALSNRPELQALELLSKVNTEKVKVVRSEYLPQVAFTANYLWTNPSTFNGFEKKMKGMWNVGLMVKVPILNWGESYYKVKSAKVKALISNYTLDETREKIELQTTQCAQRVIEAANREETAQRSMAEAEENLRFANLGMNEGVIPISNVIMAQTAWLSAKSTVLTARIDRRLAEVNLKRAMGTTK